MALGFFFVPLTVISLMVSPVGAGRRNRADRKRSPGCKTPNQRFHAEALAHFT